ncbi:MAG: quinonprotein alcohol dehydrogenase [Rhodospirillaceae bacterium]|nr:quinonprotein alcohol dehydrogenase [Rhodospirillaceae bacterium]
MKTWQLSAGTAVGAVLLAVSAPAASLAQDYVTDEMLLEADQDPNNWLMAPRDYAGTRYSPLGSVNLDTVGRLVPKWTFSFGVLDAQNTTPLVNDGVMYATASHGRTFAIDARTGEEIWRYYDEIPEGVAGKMCCDIGNRGAALYHDKVYVTTPDSDVVALDAKTGEVVWQTNIGDWEKAITMTVAPLVVKGKVIVGVSGAEYPTRLYIEALDAETGEQVWRRYTIPAPGEPGHETWGSDDSAEFGGGSAWITGSYDPDLDTLYWGVGNPNPDWDGTNRPGDNLYSNSTLALDPDTGEIKHYFQYTPHDVWDFDGNNEPILLDVGDQKLLMHGDRNGFLYAVDRTDSSFVYGVPISKVNWATGFEADGRPIVNPEKVPGYNYEATDICPASEGGKWWNPMSVNPVAKTVFVPSREICTDIKSAPLGKGLNPPERTVGKPYWGIGTIKWNKGYGQLVAFDAATGEKKWTVKAPSPFTSGILTTSGGLVFAGTPEGYFKAYSQATGEEVFSYNVGTGIFGSPMTYAIDGKQYVAVPAGFGGWTGWATIGGGGAPQLKDSRKGGYLMVFGLFDE